METQQPQDQPEETPGKPQKTPGQLALEEIRGLKKDLFETLEKWDKRRKAPNEAEMKVSEQPHGPSSVRVPFWKYCPTGDCKDGPHEVSEAERKKIVKCPGCSQLASTEWDRCPTCGHEGADFSPTD